MTGERVELCFSSYHFYPVHGGGQLRFLYYFPGLRQRGIHTAVVTGTPQASKLTNDHYIAEWKRYRIGSAIPAEPLDGTPIHRVRLPDENGMWRRTVYNRELVRYCRRPGYYPDVVQLFQTLPHRSIMWLSLLKKSGISLAYAYTAPAKLPVSFFKRVLRLSRIRMVSRLIDCIIVSSSQMSRQVQEVGFRGRIETIPNGIDLKRFYPNPSDPQCQRLRAALGMNETSIMIITVGSLIPEKGADLLIEAWTPLANRFPNIHLVVIGTQFDPDHPQKGKYQKKIASLVAACGASNRIHFTGHVPDIHIYYRACDMFVFPTLKEGMPNVVLEAMGSGAPVVLTHFPTLPQEFGRCSSEYLISERNPEALSVQMESLISNSALRRELGGRGRRWVEQVMDLEMTLDRYAAIYRELARRDLPVNGRRIGFKERAV